MASDLFGGLKPSWMGPEQRALVAKELAEPFSRAFNQSLLQSRSQKFQKEQDAENWKQRKEMVEDERRYRQQEMDRAFEMNERVWNGGMDNGKPKWMEGGSSYLNPNEAAQTQASGAQVQPTGGAPEHLQDISKFSAFVAQNPGLAVHPYTKDAIGAIGRTLKMQEDVKNAATRAEALSIEGRLAQKDAADFARRLDKLDPSARAGIRSMSKNEDGTPSKMAWDALGIAEQAMEERSKNEANLARLEAEQAGAKKSVTITDNGVTERYTPAEDKADTTPAVVEAGGKKFLRFGKSLRDISGLSESDKIVSRALLSHLSKLDNEILIQRDNAARSSSKEKKQQYLESVAQLQKEYESVMGKLQAFGSEATAPAQGATAAPSSGKSLWDEFKSQ